MSLLLTGIVAGTYIGAVVGLHRAGVWRRRRALGGFPVLLRLDWEALLEGLPEEGEAQRAVRAAVLHGVADGLPHRALEAGYSEEEADWLTTLSLLASHPEAALARLSSRPLLTPRARYLYEHLLLRLHTHALNLEYAVFAAKRRLHLALLRHGDVPALYFVRAQASSLLGFNAAAVDDLARAVYFSGQAPFYVRAVLDTPAIAEERPALYQQCQGLLPGATGA